MELISGIEQSANALAAHKLQMRLISENIANAQTTRAPNGKPYQRKIPIFESVLDKQGLASVHVKEIKTVEYGERMNGLLKSKEDDLYGIVNGIDTRQYDPKTDTRIYKNLLSTLIT